MKDKLRIAVCEDLAADRDRLVNLIKESDVAAHIDLFESGEAFLDRFRPGLYHLVYLDIYMGERTGMETAAAIRERDEVVLLVFTTTSRDHALEANKHRSLLYIEKPVAKEMVEHTLTVAHAVREQLRGQVLTVTSNYKQVDIRYTDLDYISVSDQRCVVHLRDGDVVQVSTLTNIDQLEAQLPTDRFCRTHRSYIVNLDQVRKPLEDGALLMKNGDTVFVTRKDFARVVNLFHDRGFQQARSEFTL